MRLRKSLLLLVWALCASLSVFSQATERAEHLPDGSVLLSPQTFNALEQNLNLLEQNFERQKHLSTSLGSELNTAQSSLTELRAMLNEQERLTASLRIQWTLIAERLSESDQSLAWVMEDAALMEAELTRERATVQRLDRSARVWRIVAIVAGILALGAGTAAVLW
jgi:uncharacterized protein HemX